MKSLARYRFPLVGFVTLIITEAFLRIAFGLGNPVLFQKDVETGYRFKPNQKITRFEKRMEYNQFSQRSKTITLEKPNGTIRVLMLGDSVLNGGNPIDQSETITALLENKIKASGHSIEVLNASASSWGIGNQLGYIRKFGTFQSNIVILLIGSHNLTQPTSTSDRVGQNPFFPDHPPLFAIQEGIVRYVLPDVHDAVNTDESAIHSARSLPVADQQFQQNMKLLKEIISLGQKQNASVNVLYTPDRKDVLPTVVTPNYKPEFIRFLAAEKTPVLDVHRSWSTLPKTTVSTYFRDSKHLTVGGNKTIANFVYENLCSTHQLKQCS